MKIVGKMNSKAIKRSTFKNYITLLCIASSIFFLAACDPLEPATESLYTMHFDLNGVEGATPDTQIIHEGEFAEHPYVEVDDRGSHGKFAAIEWYQNKDGSGPAFQFASTPITSSYWFYAKWTNDFQTVTFEPNYTGAQPFFRHVGTGKTVEKPADAMRANFTFVGWLSDKTDPVAFDFANTPISTDITLYAGWRSGYVFDFKGREYTAILNGDTFLLNVGKTYTLINDQKVRLVKVPFGFTTKPVVGSEIQLSKSWGSLEANENKQQIDYKVKVFLQPDTRAELKAIVDAAITTEGRSVDLNFVETHRITDMSGVFQGQAALHDTTSFHGDVSKWNTSNVTNMRSMFWSNTAFNGDISKWDTSNVRDMTGMFGGNFGNSAFNGDISKWNTSNVRSMEDMFRTSGAFNGDISKWDTSNVTNMSGMFAASRAFNGDISRWDTSNVRDMSAMFGSSRAFNRDLSGWDTSNVTNMEWMFSNAYVFSGDISKWNTSNVTNMTGIFNGNKAFNGDISKWDTSNVTIMRAMFWGNKAFNGDISKWNTSNVRNMQGMFHNNKAFNGDISKWNTSNVTSMIDMFGYDKIFNRDISKWNTSNVRDMSEMFWHNKAFNGDISKWDTSNVTSMSEMFRENMAFNGDISKWDISNVRNMNAMFYSNTAFNGNLSGWNVDKVSTWNTFFAGAVMQNFRNNVPARFR